MELSLFLNPFCFSSSHHSLSLSLSLSLSSLSFSFLLVLCSKMGGRHLAIKMGSSILERSPAKGMGLESTGSRWRRCRGVRCARALPWLITSSSLTSTRPT